jgi:hypothetical protein
MKMVVSGKDKMKNIEELVNKLGNELTMPFARIVNARFGTGFSMWSLGNTIYVDFYGSYCPEEINDLSDLTKTLHKNIESGTVLDINFFQTQNNAEERMLEKMKEGR